MTATADPRGSLWRRWDPHIHTPGTALNNQFGATSWEEYLTAIEQSEPRIQALGITDYCGIDEYKIAASYKASGRLADVGLIFPNIEFRLPTATRSDKGVNIHLLVSPEDPQHVVEIERFLRSLTFKFGGEQYACTSEDLIKLGRTHDSKIVDDEAARRAGVNQFKVSLDDIKDAVAKSTWAQRNVLIAVAGGATDGTSGVRDPDSSLESVRAEIERVSHVIFAASPKQRAFWLGEGAANREELEQKYGGLKPCLHGSDAHSLSNVGKPDEDRYSWIKGDATFEALRQACLEPRERAIVAAEPPGEALPGQVIQSLVVSGADWITNESIPLSSGLVAIIGARGSGKTALADLIAAGAGAGTGNAAEQTFIQRARRHLTGARVDLTWADQDVTGADLLAESDESELPRVQYLSQQFVERLCSAEGMTDELLREIERVIFEAHPFEERFGAGEFRELLDIKADSGRAMRKRAQEEIDSLSVDIENERAAIADLPKQKLDRAALATSLGADQKARGSLVVKGGEERSRRLQDVNDAVTARQAQVDALKQQESVLAGLDASLADYTTRKFPSALETLKREHKIAGLSDEEWAAFEFKFAGDPIGIVATKLSEVRSRIQALTGDPVPKPEVPLDQLGPFFADDADLGKTSLNLLRAEQARLGAVIGLDRQKQEQLRRLTDKISKAEIALSGFDARIKSAEGAEARIKILVDKRKSAYAALFDGFVEEQKQLEGLYSPLAGQLTSEIGALSKLTFTVRRAVNIDAWAMAGEGLLDLRKAGPFRGRGELLAEIRSKLLNAWESGGSDEVAEAMASFRADNDAHFIAQSKVSKDDKPAYRQWANEVSEWLNSTSHISVQYGVQYDGVDIEQLSPGTRGIVLLLLYLAIDQTDDRPLIIDQPEENLDPKSVFDELVGRFVETRKRRQIIIVTHNANLVVNTDVDQVIVANAGPHRPMKLPKLTYVSGGLENPVIRNEVCEILEGGRAAFEERARRLRMNI